MNETRNSRDDVFRYLANTKCLVKMSTAAVIKGAVHRDYVVVHDAPPRVVRELINNFVMVGLSPDGLMIPIDNSTEG